VFKKENLDRTFQKKKNFLKFDDDKKTEIFLIKNYPEGISRIRRFFREDISLGDGGSLSDWTEKRLF